MLLVLICGDIVVLLGEVVFVEYVYFVDVVFCFGEMWLEFVGMDCFVIDVEF